ncbi:MAG TPA: hypothetical protein VH298_00425 [Jatrophihabitans sp.]|nr:hypothetical protein [Jatrophihabitans sp.]
MKQSTRSATEQALGIQLAQAIADQDTAALRALFATPVAFSAVTPKRFWDAETAVQAVDDILLGAWFGSSTVVTGMTVLDSGMVGDVEKITYQLALVRDGVPSVVEQSAYLNLDDGLISQLRLACSGIRPVTAA